MQAACSVGEEEEVEELEEEEERCGDLVCILTRTARDTC